MNSILYSDIIFRVVSIIYMIVKYLKYADYEVPTVVVKPKEDTKQYENSCYKAMIYTYLSVFMLFILIIVYL